jgi:hypothetical protein
LICQTKCCPVLVLTAHALQAGSRGGAREGLAEQHHARRTAQPTKIFGLRRSAAVGQTGPHLPAPRPRGALRQDRQTLGIPGAVKLNFEHNCFRCGLSVKVDGWSASGKRNARLPCGGGARKGLVEQHHARRTAQPTEIIGLCRPAAAGQTGPPIPRVVLSDLG